MKVLLPLDLLRVAALGRGLGNGAAYTRESLPRAGGGWLPLVKGSLRDIYTRRESSAVFCSRAVRLTAVASAHRLAGPSSWEVNSLRWVAGGEEDAAETLSFLAYEAAKKGAKVVLLRLVSEDAFATSVRKEGFFRSHQETLYGREPREAGQHNAPAIAVEPAGPEHAMALFRLYCASTPSEVRAYQGMTFDMWQSSREPSRRGDEEWVVQGHGSLRAWVRITLRGRLGTLSLMVHPQDELELTGALMDFGLSRAGGSRAMYMLVPEYQVLLSRLAAQRGFQPRAEFVVLVRSLAESERLEEAAGATAISR